MRKKILIFVLLALILFVFPLVFSAAGESIAGVLPETEDLYPGVVSSFYSLPASSPYGVQKITIVEFDPRQEDLYFNVGNTRNNLNQLRTVSASAKAFTEQNGEGKTVIAALNGDMWTTAYAHSRVLGSGTQYGGYSDAVVKKSLNLPRGFTMYGGEIVCSRHMVQETPFEGDFQSFGIAADGTPLLGDIVLGITVLNHETGEVLFPDGLNRLPANNAFVVYTDKGPVSNYALDDAWEIAVDFDFDYVVTDSALFTGTVSGVYAPGEAKPSMQENRIILTLRGDKAALHEKFFVGDEVSFGFSILDLRGNTEQWKTVTDAVGGHMPMLIDGVPTGLADNTRYPASILGIKENGNVIMLINDGRQSGYSTGVRISSWASILSEMGVKTAFLLDGGGSAEMAALSDGGYRIVNRPCNKKSDGSYGAERSVINSVFLSYHVHSGGEADCSARAVCEICKKPYGEIDLSRHSYVAQIVDSTCKEGGYTLHRCTRCGDSFTTNPQAPIPHDYQTKTVPATCTGQGYSEHRCSVCGDCYRSAFIPALGHSGGKASCLSPAVCEICRMPYGEPDPNAHSLAEDRCALCGKKARKCVFGDWNGDGKVDSADGVLAARFFAKWTVSPPGLACADLNGSGDFDAADGMILSRWLAKWRNIPRVGEVFYDFSETEFS